jgi:pSer/pThr/pTyr-binding forkhead associated (FHA) protein
MRVQLVPVCGDVPVDIPDGLTVVGRDQRSDLCLPWEFISRAHCVLMKGEGRLMVRDLSSRNGTRVNGKRVRERALGANDVLEIGRVPFRVILHRGCGPDLPGPLGGGRSQTESTT